MQPRYYQTESVEAAWRYLHGSPGSPLIVLPTGAGKSWVIAMLCERARRFGGRVMILAHRKELLKQNAEKVQTLTSSPVGIYSAGLKSRDTRQDVVVAGIQSAYRKAEDFGQRNLILIDEAHLISQSDDTMYQTFLAAFPAARMIGLTATPYRTGEGPLAGPGRMFQRICYEASVGDLIKQGFLSELTTRPTAQVDTSKVGIRGGEFVAQELARVFDDAEIVLAACRETVAKAADRQSILVFTTSVAHAEHVCQTLQNLTSERVGLITGETFAMERAETLRQFSTGALRWLVNCEVLTTGFDSPRIDCIAVMRATLSPGLFCQMVGRGLRLFDGKSNCLVLDFGGNIQRHGNLDSADYGRDTGGESAKAKAAAKNGRGRECLNCGIDVPTGQAECYECGFVFPVVARHGATADDSEITGATIENWVVLEVGMLKHVKAPDKPPSLRVIYTLQPIGQEGNLLTNQISEWVCFEHQGFAHRKAVAWWQERSHQPVPTTVDEAIELWGRGVLVMPSRIETTKDGKWHRVSRVEFDDPKPHPDEWQEPVAVDDYFGEEVPF